MGRHRIRRRRGHRPDDEDGGYRTGRCPVLLTAWVFRPLPSGAAQMWEDGAVTIFDRGGTRVQQLDAHQEPVRDVVVAPDGTGVVCVGDGPLIVLWDVDPVTGPLVPA